MASLADLNAKLDILIPLLPPLTSSVNGLAAAVSNPAIPDAVIAQVQNAIDTVTAVTQTAQAATPTQ